MFNAMLPSLSDLLAPTCLSEIARRVGRPRGYIWRLRHGQLLHDESLIAPLAQALHQSEDYLRTIVDNDVLRSKGRSA